MTYIAAKTHIAAVNDTNIFGTTCSTASSVIGGTDLGYTVQTDAIPAAFGAFTYSYTSTSDQDLTHA